MLKFSFFMPEELYKEYLEFCKVLDYNYTPASVNRFKEFKDAGLTI